MVFKKESDYNLGILLKKKPEKGIHTGLQEKQTQDIELIHMPSSWCSIRQMKKNPVGLTL